ncbi:MAG: helix-turn-helix domain-containing protein [Candidatus Zixiibacteriota bacterium]|nr:MAG: helix-turn-helix domain-containing protein [candidate division Zixibacteria bacterium]
MTIEQLSSVTRLNAKFIEALESGRRDLLPGQVYLKPFVKTCAEALNLDVKELYKIINGEPGHDDQGERRIEFHGEIKKRRDYKLLLVLLIAVIIIAVIYFTVKTREKTSPDTGITEVIPAEATKIRDKINWSRPWERPAFYSPGNLRQNLVLVASDSVDVLILSAGDTLFDGILAGNERKVLSSEKGFVLNLSRNVGVIGFVNGQKDTVIGSGGGKLENYSIAKREDR